MGYYCLFLSFFRGKIPTIRNVGSAVSTKDFFLPDPVFEEVADITLQGPGLLECIFPTRRT